MNTDYFAFGISMSDGYYCPASAAGMNLEDPDVSHAAEIFDQFASHNAVDNDPHFIEGFVTNDDAQKCWNDTIERLSERHEEGYDEIERIHAAARVARRLGWEQ